MISPKTACEMARKLADVTEYDHFESRAFKANKRTFATVWEEKNRANLRLDPDQQRRFLEEGDAFEEIDNAWGRQGWTQVNFEFVEKAIFQEALKAAWIYSSKKSTRLSSGEKKAKARK